MARPRVPASKRGPQVLVEVAAVSWNHPQDLVMHRPMPD